MPPIRAGFAGLVERVARMGRAPLLALAACGPQLAGSAAPLRPSSAAPRVWEYRVRATPGARELRVDVELPAGVPEELGLDAFAHPFLSGLELETEQGWLTIARTGRHWNVSRCRQLGCRLRYVYRLAEAARAIDRFAYAGYRAGALLAPPSTFLLAPQDYDGTDVYRFSVELAPGEDFVTGVWREATARALWQSAARGQPGVTGAFRPTLREPEAARASTRAVAALRMPASSRTDAPTRSRGRARPAVFAAPASVLFQAPFSAFGAFERERLDLAGATLALAVAPGSVARPGQPPAGLGVSRDGLRAALQRAASAVSGYYGRFPVPEATVIVLPSPGADIFGMQLGNGGAAIVLFLGTEIDDERLARDWVVTHELLHLGFPTLGRRHLWLAEGLATYQEPIARVRAGLIDERELWRALVDGMPNGLPNATDGGLDGSMRWGRTYWGGALFCLLLDVEIRARTDNRLSLDSAARAILQGGGDTSMRWSLEQTLAVGDAALDQPSLSELYAEHSAAPVSVDLDALFRRLGVRRDGNRVWFDDTAELAHVRRAIGRPAHVPHVGLSAPGVP
jgi:hypothetical protein